MMSAVAIREGMIREIEEILALWDASREETYRDLAIIIIHCILDV